MITTSTGTVAATNHYYAFGEWAGGAGSTPEPLRFTGHERDPGMSAGTADDLDYMHARYYHPQLGRFLATDRAPGAPLAPQSWNRYVYGQSSPVKYVDPDGDSATLAGALIGGALGGGLALVQGKSWREVGAAAAGGALAGAMMGSVIDTGGASLGVMVAAGALSGAAGGILEDTIAGNEVTAGSVALDAAGGASGVMLGASVGAVAQAASARSAARQALAQEIKASGERFFKKAPRGSQNFSSTANKDGSTTFRYETPGKVTGSRAVYEKTVDSSGTTVRVHKQTYDPAGSLVHDKEKLVN